MTLTLDEQASTGVDGNFFYNKQTDFVLVTAEQVVSPRPRPADPAQPQLQIAGVEPGQHDPIEREAGVANDGGSPKPPVPERPPEEVSEVVPEEVAEAAPDGGDVVDGEQVARALPAIDLPAPPPLPTTGPPLGPQVVSE